MRTEGEFMKIQKIIVFIIIILNIVSFSDAKVLKRKEYINMSNEEIRSVFLKYTPMNCTEKNVINFIRNNLKKLYEIRDYKKMLIDEYNYKKAIEEGRISEGEYYFRVRLVNYAMV